MTNMIQEKPLTTRMPIYDPRRVIEHLQTLQGVMPVRLFAILFPLWDVETTAMQREGRPYELLEKYIERGIHEGQLHTVEALVDFFGLEAEMVKKILHFLETIGHVHRNGTYWEITSLGNKSISDGTKYVSKEKRVRFYFDAFTSMPLRKEHYAKKSVHILSPDEADDVTYLKTWGYRFQRVFATQAWRTASLKELEARIDKTDNFNVPPEMQELQYLNVGLAYLPMYIVETKKTSTFLSFQGTPITKPYYMVYTGIRDLRDMYLENIINSNQTVYAALQDGKDKNIMKVWREWLQEKRVTGILPIERTDGTWQATFSPSAFEGTEAVFKASRIGDYELRDGYFIQIWCDSEVLRRRVALDRILRILKKYRQIKLSNVQEQLRTQASQLRISSLEVDDLKRRAVETNMQDIVKMLDKMSS